VLAKAFAANFLPSGSLRKTPEMTGWRLGRARPLAAEPKPAETKKIKGINTARLHSNRPPIFAGSFLRHQNSIDHALFAHSTAHKFASNNTPITHTKTVIQYGHAEAVLNAKLFDEHNS